jgi:hypothetical protein
LFDPPGIRTEFETFSGRKLRLHRAGWLDLLLFLNGQLNDRGQIHWLQVQFQLTGPDARVSEQIPDQPLKPSDLLL